MPLRGLLGGGLAQRVALAALGVAVPAVAVMAAASWWQGRSAILAEHAAANASRSRLAAVEVERALAAAVRVVDALARTPLVSSSLIDEPQARRALIDPLLAAQRDGLGVRGRLGVVDYAGRHLFGERPADPAVPVLVRSVIRSASAAGVLSSGTVVTVLPLLVPISGQAEGALVLEIELADLAALVPGVQVDVHRGRGHHPGEVEGHARRALRLPEPLDRIEIDVDVPANEDAVLAPLRRLLLLHLAALGGALVVAAVAAWLLGRLVSSPVRALAGYARGIAAGGDLTAPVPQVGRDELGLLANDLQAMVDELARARRALEGRVAATSAELHDARVRLEAVLDGIDDVVWSLSADAQTVNYLSPAAERILGLGLDELMRGAWIDAVHPDDRARLQQARAALGQGAAMDLEYRVRSAGGAERWVRDHGRAVRSPEGAVVRLDGVLSDVTARVRMQIALRDREAEVRRLAMVTSRTHNAVIIADPQGRITWVNAGFERITGWTLDEVRGRRPGDVLQGPASDPAAVAVMREALAARKPFQVELINYHRSGRPYWIEIQAQPMHDAGGRFEGYMAVERDTTAQREGEAALRAARDQAQAAASAKAAFLATMSHEIRTPLNGIIGMTDLLMAGDLPGPVRSDLAVVRDSGQMLLTLVNDVLDFSKIEAGRMEVAIADCDARTIAAEVVAMFRPQAVTRQVEIVLAAPAPGPRVRADPLRLRQILTNLVGNAVKFTERGRIELRIAVDGDEVAMAVADTGIGIPRERLARLFEEFAQGDASIARRFGGTGLGLAISRRLADLMHGRIEVESEPGRGSTFTVRLPAAAVAVAGTGGEAPLPAPSAAVRSGLRVLLAEDNPVNQRVAQGMLARFAAQVTLVADGAAAAAACTGGVFDIVLMDMQMPEVDGLEATRRIRAAEASGRRVPIIALTANAFPEDRIRCREAGMDDLLSKPMTRDALSAMLRRWT